MATTLSATAAVEHGLERLVLLSGRNEPAAALARPMGEPCPTDAAMP